MRKGITLRNDRKATRDQRIAELEIRIKFANTAIGLLRDTKDPQIAATPKAVLEESIAKYTEQRDQLVAECRRLKIERDGSPKGKASVGLKPANMAARNK